MALVKDEYTDNNQLIQFEGFEKIISDSRGCFGCINPVAIV